MIDGYSLLYFAINIHRKLCGWLAFAMLIGTPRSTSCQVTGPLDVPATVTAFIESIGINSAIDYANTAEYHHPDNLIMAMQYLGTGLLRDHTPDPNDTATWASYIAIAKSGIQFDFLLPGNGNVDLHTNIAHLDAMAMAQPASIVAIEAPNEINGWPIKYLGISDYRLAGVAVQKDLWFAVKSDPILKRMAIYGLTLSDGFRSIYADLVALGNLSQYADFANVHIYGSHGHNVWRNDLPYWLPVQTRAMPGKPVVVTETGYQTDSRRPGTSSVSETVAAKYILNLLFHNFLNGIAKTFLYNLADAPSNDPQRFGLFNADWSPKPAAEAIHNLTTILKHAGLGSRQHKLTYLIDGLPSGGHSLLLVGGDKVFGLVVWREVTIWDAVAAKEITVPTYHTTVEFTANKMNVAVYDPLISTVPIATAHSVKVVSASIVDHPIVIVISPDIFPPKAQ
jgi:hypothetical protein